MTIIACPLDNRARAGSEPIQSGSRTPPHVTPGVAGYWNEARTEFREDGPYKPPVETLRVVPHASCVSRERACTALQIGSVIGLGPLPERTPILSA